VVIVSVPSSDTHVHASGAYTTLQNGTNVVYEFTGNGDITF
jgi:hypothetical protein